MMPMTSVAAWVLLYSLCSRTRSPHLMVARGSPMQVDMLSTEWTSLGFSVATDRQMDLDAVRVGVAGRDGVLRVTALVDVQPHRLQPLHAFRAGPVGEGDFHVYGLTR